MAQTIQPANQPECELKENQDVILNSIVIHCISISYIQFKLSTSNAYKSHKSQFERRFAKSLIPVNAIKLYTNSANLLRNYSQWKGQTRN